jgi:hypothetical protein
MQIEHTLISSRRRYVAISLQVLSLHTVILSDWTAEAPFF